MIKNIVFDWSGVVVNSWERQFKVVNLMFKKLGRKEGISMEELTKEFTIPYMKFWNKYFPDLGKEEEDKLYLETIKEMGPSEFYPGAADVIKKLHNKGFKLAVLSSDLPSTLIPEAKKGKIHDLFIEIGSNVHHKDEELIELLKRNNFKPEETVYIGDTWGDVVAGKKAGVVTVAINWKQANEKKLIEVKPDFLIYNLKELLDLNFNS